MVDVYVYSYNVQSRVSLIVYYKIPSANTTSLPSFKGIFFKRYSKNLMLLHALNLYIKNEVLIT
eukprot:snap_masked-scaffold_12-processed-gene-1.44-mRNA-1 protein AED:1.00 eAED:1.00 QI:0/0/0/0/1/1/2/0/63